MNRAERASILEKSLELLHDTGIILHSLRKLIGQICYICSTFLTVKSTDSILITVKNRGKLILITVKNRGNLIFPSEDVIKTTRCCEIVIRSNYNIIRIKKNIKAILITKVFNEVCHTVFNNSTMIEHILQQHIFNNHRTELIKSIITIYINLRLFHEAKCATEFIHKKYIRRKFTKLIHFKIHQ